MSASETKSARKDYAAPRITHTEKIEGRAAVCAKADDGACAAGPIQS